MPFPVSSSGSISVPADSPDSLRAVTLAIEDALCEAKAKDIRTSGETILFRAGAFRPVFGWNQLLAVSSGEIQIKQDGALIHVRYRIWFLQILILVSVIVGLLGVCIRSLPIQSFVLAWLWLFGGNYIATLYRFPRFLRAAVEKGIVPPPLSI
jgi:hypothetical protein